MKWSRVVHGTVSSARWLDRPVQALTCLFVKVHVRPLWVNLELIVCMVKMELPGDGLVRVSEKIVLSTIVLYTSVSNKSIF